MINYYSTRKKSGVVALEEAVMRGIAEDGGLYMPQTIPQMPDTFFQNISDMTFPEISFAVAKALLAETIPEEALRGIVDRSMNFEVPLKKITEQIYALELFYGPTLSFKDVGARFMAQLVSYFAHSQEQTLHILVATSGDTGSAIAQAFLDMPQVKVWILYPEGKVSWIQEKQLTTMGKNITALEVQGTFDDCQRLVKEAFADGDLRKKLRLTSANSINIARLIPQSFYYFYAYAQLQQRNIPLIFSVPSGNFGNLTAGLLAKKMGLSVKRFVAPTNINDTVPRYLSTGIFEPRPSKATLSNAMDVGNPSNFARMLDICGNMKEELFGVSFTDEETAEAIREVFERYSYLLDPHGAVGYLGAKKYLSEQSEKMVGIFLETAHPAKFADEVEKIIQQKIDMPPRLQEVLAKEKHSILLSKDYSHFKSVLLKED